MASYEVTNTYIISQGSTFVVLFVLKQNALDHLSVASPYGLK